jgi:hypothetical protein
MTDEFWESNVIDMRQPSSSSNPTNRITRPLIVAISARHDSPRGPDSFPLTRNCRRTLKDVLPKKVRSDNAQEFT